MAKRAKNQKKKSGGKRAVKKTATKRASARPKARRKPKAKAKATVKAKPVRKPVKRSTTRKVAKLPPAPRKAAKRPKPATKRKAAAKQPAKVRVPEPVAIAEQTALRAKFEFAPPGWAKVLDEREKAQTIPWGYGLDRCGAMAIDPDRLFVHWEVTDDGVAATRARLGDGGNDATLALRVHDVTGLLFDGDNSHHFQDIAVARADRRWFLDVNRPTSNAVVEIGLRATNGRFAAIARSHRVDFPRREPLTSGPVEWMTVRVEETPATATSAAATPPTVGTSGATRTRKLETTRQTASEATPRTTRPLRRFVIERATAGSPRANSAQAARRGGRSSGAGENDATPPIDEDGALATAIERAGSEERLRRQSTQPGGASERHRAATKN